MMECPQCNATEIFEDGMQCELSCDACGYVWQMEVVDSEEFQDLGNGKKQIVGTRIQLNKSRHKTIIKARNKMENLASRVDISLNVVSKAIKIYESCLNAKLCLGIKSELMMGACLYVAAKQTNSPIMLIDISDKLSISVFKLGKVYTMIKRKLELQFNETDPCIFIERFSHELDIKSSLLLVNKENEYRHIILKIQKTALKIIQCFKKDWITTGRKPGGVAASALLVSCRVHGFDRDFDDAARISGVAPSTIKNRLNEFLSTGSSNLTEKDLLQENLDEYEADPPAFQNIKDMNETKCTQEEIESQFIDILTQLDATETNSDSLQYKEILERSIQEVGLNSDQLINLVADDDIEEFLETDNDELMGRVNIMKKCIMGQPVLDNKIEYEDVEYEEMNLPTKLNLPEIQTTFDFVSEPEIPQEYLDANEDCFNSLEESHRILRWFFNQKDNRDFFKKQKERDENKKRKLLDEKSKELANKRRKTSLAYKQKVIEEHQKSMNLLHEQRQKKQKEQDQTDDEDMKNEEMTSYNTDYNTLQTEDEYSEYMKNELYSDEASECYDD